MIKFGGDQDRHAWREYAKGALQGLLSRQYGGTVEEILNAMESYADGALLRERVRRDTGRGQAPPPQPAPGTRG